MKKLINIFAGLSFSLAIIILLNINADAQLLNEVEIDPPVDVGDRCQYVEILGTPGGTVPANTYFISVNSDQDNFGFLNVAVNIGGQTYGSNGTLTLLNSLQGTCPNRSYGTATTIVNYSSLTSLGQGSEGFYVVTSATNLQAGTDADSNNDGAFDNSVTFVDGFNLIFNPEEQFVYGPGPNLVEVLLGDVADAATRFAGNTSANSAAAWYSGELATTPEETTAYGTPVSSNFPQGGMLTPGATNVPGSVPSEPTDFDYDGDGRADLSIFRPSEGNWWINGSTNGLAVINWGLNGDQIVPADYDGDDKTDTAIFRPTNTAGQADFWILNSNGFTFSAVEWGSPNDIPAIADYNGDGNADVAVYRPTDNTFYILVGGGSTITPFGVAGDLPVPADYDGDGNADVAVYQNGTYMAMLSGGGTVTIPVGQAGDRAVPADYDGDNIVDQAVFRPSSGTWLIRQSTTTNIVSVPFGISTDIPVAADYDGDGRADVAIYRGGQWWVNGSTSGISVQNFGLGSDTPTPSAYNR